MLCWEKQSGSRKLFPFPVTRTSDENFSKLFLAVQGYIVYMLHRNIYEGLAIFRYFYGNDRIPFIFSYLKYNIFFIKRGKLCCTENRRYENWLDTVARNIFCFSTIFIGGQKFVFFEKVFFCNSRQTIKLINEPNINLRIYNLVNQAKAPK